MRVVTSWLLTVPTLRSSTSSFFKSAFLGCSALTLLVDVIVCSASVKVSLQEQLLDISPYLVVLLASLPKVAPLLEPRVPKSFVSVRPWIQSRRAGVPQVERAEMAKAKAVVPLTHLELGE